MKGPSKPAPDAPEGGDYAIMDGGTNIIAEVFFRSCERVTNPALANGRLIAAAPDLLEACQEYAAWADKVFCKDAELRAIREKIRGAIAKATGEQS